MNARFRRKISSRVARQLSEQQEGKNNDERSSTWIRERETGVGVLASDS